MFAPLFPISSVENNMFRYTLLVETWLSFVSIGTSDSFARNVKFESWKTAYFCKIWEERNATEEDISGTVTSEVSEIIPSRSLLCRSPLIFLGRDSATFHWKETLRQGNLCPPSSFFFPLVSRLSARGSDASNEVSARLVIEVVADVPTRHRPCNKCTTKTSFVSEHCLTARRAAGKRWKTIRLVGRFSSGRVPAAVALMPFLYQPKWRSTASLSLYREYMKRKERTRRTERDRERGWERKMRKLQTGCGNSVLSVTVSWLLARALTATLDLFPRLRNDGKKLDRLDRGECKVDEVEGNWR